VLPKGKIEPSETMREAAVREVREEVGVWASVEEDLGEEAFVVNGRPVRGHFFLMRAQGTAEPREQDRGRTSKWTSPEEVIDLATHPETRLLLERAAVAVKPGC
jgi:8-oxo-dGTP pyrophosphatase MutT (NUDIX family)